MSNLTPWRVALCDWLRRHDIDPGTIPNDAAITHETQTGIWTIEFATIDDGSRVNAPRRTIRFVEREPFPDKPQRPVRTESGVSDNDLAAWLRVQLDEDERRAAGSGNLGWLTYRHADGSMDHTEASSLGGDETWIVAGKEAIGFDSAVVVHQESRVLAEVEAKRAILDDHAPVQMTAGWGCSAEGIHGWCQTIRWLAHPFADRPGYLDVWKPWRP